jgi:hypothetical protein
MYGAASAIAEGARALAVAIVHGYAFFANISQILCIFLIFHKYYAFANNAMRCDAMRCDAMRCDAMR